MSGFYGADTDALRDLGQKFRAHGERLIELQGELAPRIMDASIWVGPDADAFRQSWQQRAFEFTNVADRVTDRHLDLVVEAAQQDHASAEDGDAPWWEKALDLAKIGVKGYSLYKAGKTMLEGIDDMRRLWEAFRLGPDDFARVWESLKLKNFMKLEAGGFGKLLSSVMGKFMPEPVKGLIHSDIWKKLASPLDGIPGKLAEGEKIAKLLADKADGIAKFGNKLGKAVPFLDIAFGVHSMATAEDGYGVASGALSTAGGALMLAGVAFPPLAAVGGVLSAVSLGMDLIDMGGEFFGTDPSKAVSDAVSAGVEKVGEWASDVGSAISKGLGSIFG